MLHTRSLVLFTICVTYTASEYLISSDGWIPITSENVYNPMNFMHPPLKSHTITSNTIKIIKAQNDQDKERKPPNTIFNSGNQFTNIGTSLKTEDKTRYGNNENIHNATESARKGKQINERHDENSLDDDTIIETYNEVLKEDADTKRATVSQRSNTYEVVEDTYSGQDNEQDNLDGFGYDYSPPIPQNFNFSSTLIKILSKYNIKTDDKLQNYDISRQPKIQIPSHSTRVLNLHRYNSLNHLPVDPLLAVFLSNYGFYIPSLYGIKSNYNNLYGYLASNNIHNNRPFGLYKIFSDTDSWN